VTAIDLADRRGLLEVAAFLRDVLSS